MRCEKFDADVSRFSSPDPPPGAACTRRSPTLRSDNALVEVSLDAANADRKITIS